MSEHNLPEQEQEFVERRKYVPDNEHYEHHLFIREWVEKERRKREMADKIKAQVGGWIIISSLGAVATAAWHGYSWLKDHLK